MTTALLRPQAEADLVERTRYFRLEAGAPVGERFFEAAVAALRRIERLPRVGSLCVGELCGIPGLRVSRIEGFACGWCSFVVTGESGTEDIDVVRLLAFAQDLPAILSDLDPE